MDTLLFRLRSNSYKTQHSIPYERINSSSFIAFRKFICEQKGRSWKQLQIVCVVQNYFLLHICVFQVNDEQKQNDGV